MTLITGPEQFLAERELARRIAQAQEENPEAGVRTTLGADLVPTVLDEIFGTDLFSSATIACITDAEKTPSDIQPRLLKLAGDVPENVALIITHSAGNTGKALLDKLASLATIVINNPVLKPASLVNFVIQEARVGGKKLDMNAARSLIDALGYDTRSLAAAVTQLIADSDKDSISAGMVNQYFAGRATVTSYKVSDDALAGRVGEAIFKLRWALSTGVAHTQITSALAGSLRQMGMYLAISAQRQPTAAEIGAPSWKLKEIAASSASWTQISIARAIRAVSLADAQIKGAARDPDFALEHLIIKLSHIRRSAPHKH